MIIELQRAFSPEDLKEEPCGICGHVFMVESVMIQPATDGLGDMGRGCPTCLEIFDREVPQEGRRWPSIVEYEELKERYPEPIWATQEEASEAMMDNAVFDEAYAESWVWEAEDVRERSGR